MNQNETEFANQDEEISYKDMWLRLKKDLASMGQAYVTMPDWMARPWPEPTRAIVRHRKPKRVI